MPRKKHFNPERKIHNRRASPKRAKLRAEAKRLFLAQIAKERAVGIDPQFQHAQRFASHRDAWLKRSRGYDLYALKSEAA